MCMGILLKSSSFPKSQTTCDLRIQSKIACKNSQKPYDYSTDYSHLTECYSSVVKTSSAGWEVLDADCSDWGCLQYFWAPTGKWRYGTWNQDKTSSLHTTSNCLFTIHLIIRCYIARVSEKSLNKLQIQFLSRTLVLGFLMTLLCLYVFMALMVGWLWLVIGNNMDGSDRGVLKCTIPSSPCRNWG